MSTNIKLKRSSVAGKQPNTSILEFGEVAINTYDGKMFFKKDDGEETIVTLQEATEDNIIINASFFDNASANTLGGVLYDLDQAITSLSGGGLAQVTSDSTLNGLGTIASPLSVANNGHTHTANNITDFGSSVNTAIDARVTQSFVNALNIDADLLDGANSDFYLDYTNFTNTPTLYTTADANNDIDARVTQSFVNALNVDAATLDGSNGTFYLDYTNFTNTPTIGDATITFSGDSVILPTGSFSLNDTTNTEITLAVNTAAISITESQISDFGTYLPTADFTGTANTWLATRSTTNLSEGTNLYYTLARANTAIDDRVTKGFVDALRVDSDTLDGFQGSYYLNYTNLTNKPTLYTTADANNDIDARVTKSFVDALNVDADTLDGANGSFYLDYTNFSNTPTLYTTADANNDIDARVTKSFVDALNVDADTLDGANGSFYLDYTNFTNTPSIPQSGVDFDPVGTDNSTDVTLAGTYDYLTLSGQQITLNQIDYSTDISNLPTLYTTADANTDIDARVTKSFVDALNVDADTLDGANGTFYLDYTNFTNTPTIVNYYATSWSWSNGTTSGPTATIGISGTSDVSVASVPVANGTNSGVVTTGTQTFAGDKTFANGVSVDTLTLATKDPGPAHQEGMIYYNDEYKALTVYTDISDVSLQVGLEDWIRVYNATGSTILNGTPVYVTGANGETPTVAPADATTEAKARVLGIATHDIADASEGFITERGLLSGIDTSNLTAGQPFHLSPSGGLQTNAPTYPYYPIDLGRCIVSSNTNGYIYVSLENHVYEQFRVTGNQHIDGNITIDGNLIVNGTESIVSQQNLSIADSFVYLNTGDAIGESGTSFSGSGLDDAYFTGYFEGTTSTTYYVRIDGVGTGTGGVDTFEWSTDNFSTTEATGVDITGANQALSENIKIFFNATTGHTSGDTWSGTAAPIAVDTGWVTNRNTGASGVGYTHMGVYFDVSDEKFKVFDEYDPEVEGTIDTGHASFSLGTLVAGSFEGNLTGTANNATNLNGQAAAYYLDFTNFTNLPDPVITLGGDLSGSVTLTNLANGTLTATVSDNSHNHTVSNISDFTTGANTAIDNRVTKSFVDALNVDADTLDGANGSFYLDYTNFTNTPSIPQSGVDFDPVGTDNSTNVTLAGSYDYLTLSGQQITLNQIDYATDISNKPTLYTTANANTDIDARVTKSFVDALNVDADTLDGIDSASFLRSDAVDVGTTLELNGGLTYDPSGGGTGTDTATDVGIALSSGTRIVGYTNGYIRSLLEWNESSDIQIGQGSTSLIGGINLLPGASGDAKVNGNRILTVADEGSGNGLDADLLDGQQGSYYTNASNLASGTVPTARLGTGTANSTTYLAGDQTWKEITSGGGGTTWSVKTANYTAVTGDGIVADTSGGTFTITLPASPSAGDNVILADGGDWGATNLTVARNGSTIEDAAENLTLDVGSIQVHLIYSGTTWEVYAFTGPGVSVQADDNTTNATKYITWADAAEGGYEPKVSSTKLYFNPSTGTLNATDFNSLSDQRLKENVQDLAVDYDMLNSIRSVSFDWKDNGKSAYGFIAQELEEVMPELVATNEDNSYKSVSYVQLIPHLLEAIKDLKKQVDELKEKN
jgi:hypothetical protein